MNKQADFRAKMELPYNVKVAYAETRIHEFIKTCGKDTFVAVGGLDSITLLQFIRSLGYNIPAVSVSSIEDKTVREVHRKMNVIEVKPLKSKYHICRDIGYPVFSKEVAKKVYVITHPTEKNERYRHVIVTGETTERAAVRNSTITKLPDKYLDLFYYNSCPVSVSDKCCYYMKEKPVQQWVKDNNAFPFLGLHADESRRRFLSLSKNGCNMYGNNARSAPFAIFTKSDILHLADDIKAPIPTVYGNIITDGTTWKTTGQARTGCDICGFGIQFEKTRPHRFDILYQTDPKKWNFWINTMQYGALFDYIGFEYKQPFNVGDSAWKGRG